MLQNHLPDGRSWKRLWEGWVASFTILVAFMEHRARKMSWMEGKGAPMIFAAVFTVRWRVLRSAALQFPYQTVMQLVSTLSMVPPNRHKNTVFRTRSSDRMRRHLGQIPVVLTCILLYTSACQLNAEFAKLLFII